MFHRCSAAWLAVFSLLFGPGTLLATTHYVSHAGSDTYPYDSWATATDSILLAVDAAAEWDTVRLAAGTYTADTIGLKKGLAFIGAGRDSTDIFHNGNDIQGIYLVDSCLLQGIYLHGRTDTSATGIVTFHLVEGVLALQDQSAVVRDCRFSSMKYAFQALQTDQIHPTKRVVLENSEFSSFYKAVRYWFCSSVIRGNKFLVTYQDIGGPVECIYSNSAEIRDNLFIKTVAFSSPAIELGHCDSIWVANNICIATVDDGDGIAVNLEYTNYPTSGVIENNLCMGGWGGIHTTGGDMRIRNNIIVGTTDLALYYLVSMSTPGNVGYNLYWKNGHRSPGDKAFWPDPGNLFADPMFVDSLDFHLQAFSPAIDAGDPSLLDADGSRSDIGPIGGPYGTTYIYQDLAPASPRGLTATWQDSGASVLWLSSSEADLAAYRLYRDTAPILFADPLLLLKEAAPGDTAYFDSSDLRGKTIYYRLTAMDGQGHESTLSGEVVLSVTSVPGDEDELLPREFALYWNYPNPFNAETRIEYTLPQPSIVTLTAYDALGRKLQTLVQGPQQAGAHSLVWDAGTRGSGVYFLVLDTPAWRRVQKALLLK
jgi:hypothetical protein